MYNEEEEKDIEEGCFVYPYDHYNSDGSRKSKRPRSETNVSFDDTVGILKRLMEISGDNTSGPTDFTPT